MEAVTGSTRNAITPLVAPISALMASPSETSLTSPSPTATIFLAINVMTAATGNDEHSQDALPASITPNDGSDSESTLDESDDDHQPDPQDLADQPRIPWDGLSQEKYERLISQLYRINGGPITICPTHPGRGKQVTLVASWRRKVQQLLGEERCGRCKERGKECWIYSKEGAARILMPGFACTQCRVHGARCSAAKAGET